MGRVGWFRYTAFLACFISLFLVQAVSARVLVYDGVSHEYNGEPITLKVNGSELGNLTMDPVIIDGRTLVPAKEVFEELGAVVTWAGASKEVYITYIDSLLVLQIDSKAVNLNGDIKTMDTAPKIINGKTMIPARFAAELLGFGVDWDKATRVVSIRETVYTSEVPVVDTSQTEEKSGQSTNSSAPNNGPSMETVQHPVTSITSVVKPSGGTPYFTVQASSAITGVEVSELEGRLILDIQNAALSLSSSNITISDNDNVTAVRSSQFQVEPEKVTRIVFDLKKTANYEVKLSDDRTKIYVEFAPNTITKLSLENVSGTDQLTIQGDSVSNPQITYLSDPYRLVVELDNSVLGANASYGGKGTLVSNVDMSQKDTRTVQVVLTLTEPVQFGSKQSSNQTVIMITRPNFKNMSYHNQGRPYLELEKSSGNPIDIGQVQHKDDYINNLYTITLPGNYQDIYGYGDYLIYDELLDKITIETSGGSTKLTFHENKVRAFDVRDAGGSYIIEVKNPKEKYSQIVVLDPGHGGSAPGASGNGLVEKSANLVVSQKLFDLLDKDPNIKVYMTRFDDTNPSWDDRTAKYNEFGDIFVSIHHNSNQSSKPNGTEVLYYNASGNKHSSGLTSKILAEAMQKNLIESLGSFDRGIVERPNLIVLNRAEYPAVLVEVGFLSNAEEAAKLKTDGYQQKTADSIYKTIVEMFAKYPRKD